VAVQAKSPANHKFVRMVALRCYNPAGSVGQREAWRVPIPVAFDADVDAAMEIRERERTLDDGRYFKALRGRGRGLTEVLIDIEMEANDPRTRKQQVSKRPKREKVTIRILSFGNVDDFVLLYGFRKYGNPDYGPACRSAFNRKAGVKRDGKRARSCTFN
jgi:hypothetical protein